MSRVSVALALVRFTTVLFVCLVVSPVAAQTTFEPDRIGHQQHRDYLRLQPFEQLDTQSGNIVLTLSDVTLPGNAGRDLRFILTYNSNSDDTSSNRWRFGIPGVPMTVLQEDAYPTAAFANTLADTKDITPILEMADGAKYRTVFTTPTSQLNWQNHTTMYEVWTSQFWQYHRDPDRHTLELPDGTVCSYAAVNGDTRNLRLTQIQDAFGNTVTLSWGDGFLDVQQTLVNETPRLIHFDMQRSTGLPRSMTFDGRTWSYEYEGGPNDTTGALTRITPPLGPGWLIEYQDLAGGYGYHRVSRVTTPQGGRIEYGYEPREFILDGQPPVVRAFLVSRDVTDPRSAAGNGHWSVDCVWYSGGTFCDHTIVQTPSAIITYKYDRYDRYGISPNAGKIIEGILAIAHVTVQDPATGTVMEEDDRRYTELTVVSSSYLTFEVSQRTVTRAGRHYTTSYTYAGYRLPSRIVETGDITRTTDRTYTSRLDPFVVGLVLMEKITIGSQWVRRDFDYDPQGFCTWATEPGVYPYNLSMWFTRDEGGNTASVQRRGTTTSFTYNRGQVATISMPMMNTVRTINLDGTIASEMVGGRTTTFEYDALRRLTTTHLPGGRNPIVVEYDSVAGGWVRTGQGTSVSTTTVDGFGRTILAGNSVGVNVRTEYDAEGRVTYEGYPFAGTGDRGTRRQFDALGRITRMFPGDPNGGVFGSLDYFPGYVRVTDENGHQTVQTYQAFGDPDDVRLSGVVDANQQPWTYEYDVLGELTRVITPDGLTRTWVYNDKHLLITEAHPESGTTTYSYDTYGRLTQKTDANLQATQYTYDDDNRPLTVATDERVTTIGYEPDSNLRQWVSSGPRDGRNQSVDAAYSLFLYDGAGRTTDRFDLIDGKMFSTGYAYDANDNVVAVRYPTLGGVTNRRQIGYQRDSENRITSVFDQRTATNYASNITYHSSGLITSYTAGNGISTVITPDPTRYWVQSITAGPLQLQYGYDDVGNVTSIADGRGMGQTFAYDVLDRLRVMNGTGGYPSSTHAYDAHGNQQSVENGTTYTYDPATLRLMSQGDGSITMSFTYDSNGNLKTAPNRTYQYTPENWLHTAAVNGNVTAYAYDSDGWRIKKTTGNSVTYYLRGLNGELLTEWTNPGLSGSIRDYVYTDSRLLSAVITTSTIDAGDVVSPIAAGGTAVSMTVTTSGQNGRLMFNGTMGQTVTLTLTTQSAMTCNWTFTLIAPDGSSLTTATPCSGTSVTLGPQALPTTGTYVILVDPNGSTVGTVTASVANMSTGAPSITGFLPAIGPAGTSVRITGTNLQSVDGVWVNGRPAAFTSASSNSVTVVIPTLAGSGPIRVHTAGGTAISSSDFFIPPGSYTVADLNSTGRLAFGSATVVTVSTANQVAVRTFDRVAGQRFSLHLTNRNITLAAKVYGPDGTLVISGGNWVTSQLAFFDAVTAKMSGTYTVEVDPYSTFTGNATLTLYDVPVDVNGGTLAPNGAPVTFTITTPGQNAFFSFVGAAGHRVAFTSTNSTLAYTYMTLRAPDGSTIANGNILASDSMGPYALPLDGVYQLFANPWDTYVGAATFTAYDVPADFNQQIPTDNTPLTVTTTAPFQNAYVTFSGTAGQRVMITFANGTYPGTVFGYVFNPNGSSMYGVFSAGTSQILDTKTLTVTGTHTIKLDPDGLITGSVVVRVATVPDDIVVPITPGGSAVTVTTVMGQDAYLTFAGIANQRISIRATNGTYGSCGNAYLYLLKPDGSALATSTCAAVSAFLDTKTLPVTGTYKVRVNPTGTATGGITVAVYDVPLDPTVSLTIGGGAQTLTTTVPGQNAGATFTGTAGQQVTVRITNNAFGVTWVELDRPDGTRQTSVQSSSTNFNLSTQTLGTTGTYSIRIDPNGTPNTGSIKVAVTSP